MMHRLGGVIDSKKYFPGLAVIIALTFNNWLLAIFLNRNLFLRGGSVSEFSIPDQPHAIVFRSLDIISGGLVVILVLLLVRKLVKKGFGGQLLVFSALTLGVSNIIDAFFPLSCSETLRSSCNVVVHVSLSHFALPNHAYSSIIIGLCYFTLPLGGYLFAKSHNLRAFKWLSLILITVALGSFVSVLGEYAANGSFSVRTWGFSQELQMGLVGLWFIGWQTAAALDKSLHRVLLKDDN